MIYALLWFMSGIVAYHMVKAGTITEHARYPNMQETIVSIMLGPIVLIFILGYILWWLFIGIEKER